MAQWINVNDGSVLLKKDEILDEKYDSDSVP